MGYFGSKGGSGAYQAVVAAMPPHDTYVEAFLGSGVVMRAKPPAARSIGIELDPEPFKVFSRLPIVERQGVELINGDAIRFLRHGLDFKAAGRVLVYADPPYVLAARTSAKRYRFDFDEQAHRSLIATLRALPCAVILSGYPSALYDELVGDWRQIEFQVMTRGGPRSERLWLNFPAGDVAWSAFAGANFTDRQRIKRKAERWATHYRRLPAGERLAVLAAVLGEHRLEPAEGPPEPAQRASKRTAAQTPATMVAGAAATAKAVYGGHRGKG